MCRSPACGRVTTDRQPLTPGGRLTPGSTCLWGVHWWGVFVVLLLLVNTWLVMKSHLRIVAYLLRPFVTTVIHLLTAASGRIMDHVSKLRSSQSEDHRVQMSTRSAVGPTELRQAAGRWWWGS